MEDEYGISNILLECSAEIALPQLNEQLDKVCGTYMKNRDEIRKAAFTEMTYHLYQAIIDTEDTKDYNQLKERIEKLVGHI